MLKRIRKYLEEHVDFQIQARSVGTNHLPEALRRKMALRRVLETLVSGMMGILFQQGRHLYLKYRDSPFIREVYSQLLNLSLTFVGRIVFVIIIASIGYGFFKMKKHQQYWYGILETGFALFSAYYFITDLQKRFMYNQANAALIIPAFTSLYLLVRGYTNIDEGSKKEYVFKSKIESILTRYLEPDFNRVKSSINNQNHPF